MLPKNPDISGRENHREEGWDREVGDLGGIPSDFQTLPLSCLLSPSHPAWHPCLCCQRAQASTTLRSLLKLLPRSSGS